MTSLYSIFKNSHTNVKISAFSGFVSAISTTLFLDMIMTVFIFNNISEIEGPNHKNEMLGAIETSYGLSELIFAIPIGYIADKYSRSMVLRSGAIMEYITLACTFGIVYNIANEKWSDDIAYASMVLINILFGISWGLSSGPIGALVADSTENGKRSEIYMITSTFVLVGSMIGPIMIIVLSEIFSSDTDDWDSRKLANFIYIGVILHIIPVTSMFFYKDIECVSDSDQDPESLSNPLLDTPDQSDQSDQSDHSDHSDGPFFTFVPTVMFLAELVIIMGSGMTVKFWPLFLKNDCGMSMRTIQVLGIIIIVEIIVFQYIAQKISKYFGRINTVFALNMMGITCQTVLGLLTSYDNVWLIGFLYTFRVSIMNSSGPLLNSSLMDMVPKGHRARWESLYSIITLGWCGSALLGGLINDKMDYGSTFLVTSGCHFIGNCIYLLIRNSIESEKS
jgi:MFS family permease